MGATRLSEALTLNSTLLELKVDVPSSVPPKMKEILLGKVDLNRLEKLFIPRIIDNDPKLTILKLSGYCLNSAATTRLCDVLMLNTAITSLDFSYCQIDDFRVAPLYELLKMNFYLTSLNLDGNSITDIGAKLLAEALEVNSTLTRLHVNGNPIKDAGRISLRNALITNQTLTCLGFASSNIYLTDPVVTSSRDGWIVRKNQSLYALLLQLLIKKGTLPDSPQPPSLSAPLFLTLDDCLSLFSIAFIFFICHFGFFN